MADQLQYWAGIDWGTERHASCIVDQKGGVIAERFFQHSAEGLAELSEWLRQTTGVLASKIGVAIEIPRGAIVETLVEQGFSVFAINPKQLDRFRDRHTMAGAKDDRRDALVLADSLRTDQGSFRRLRLDTSQTILLREWSRISAELKQEFRRLANQLRDTILRISPHLLSLAPAADEAWWLELLGEAPSFERLQRLSHAKVARILKDHRIRRHTSEDVVACLRQPALPVAPGVSRAVWDHVRLLLPRLRLVCRQLQETEAQLLGLLEPEEAEAEPGQSGQHRDAEIILSLPGVGVVVAATMLAEASQALAERDYHSLRALCGTAPVTRQSGKRRLVGMRRACNHRLRDAAYHMARAAVRHDPLVKAYYHQLRAKGHGFARALRSVADRQLRIMVAMLNTGTTYQRPAQAA